MSYLITILLSVAAIWSIAVITPGPNFFITAQTGVKHSRISALFVVLGIVAGTAIWGLAGFFGVALLFAVAPWAYVALKIVGGGYLIYLGIKLLIASFDTTPDKHESIDLRSLMSPIAAFRLGLLTNLANPKTAAFVASLFASTMPQQPSILLGITSILLMLSLSLLWYGAVAYLFSSPRLAIFYQRSRQWIDRIAGVIFIGFGIRLATDR